MHNITPGFPKICWYIIFQSIVFVNSRSNGKSRVYFWTSFSAYILGLGATILVMHATKHAQPALLYLVPACVGATVGLGLARGESKLLFS